MDTTAEMSTGTSQLDTVSSLIALESKRERGKRHGLKRILNRIVRRAKRLNRTHAVLGNVPHHEASAFPWVSDIERDWTVIRAELNGVLVRKDDLPAFQDILTDVATITRDNRWKTFMFLGYGKKARKNIALCPQTWRILKRIPGLKTAMFSILEPGKHIPPHKGPYNGVLRLHLPLIVPEPREAVAIRVEDRIHHWQEGKALIFDDAFEHEVWNRTSGIRVVLFVDFVKPLRFPASLANWTVLSFAPFSPFIREGYNHQRKWEARFYGTR